MALHAAWTAGGSRSDDSSYHLIVLEERDET